MNTIYPKYKITRTRDGSEPTWPAFILGAKDPAASAALWAYVERAQKLGYDPEYVNNVRGLAVAFEDYCSEHGVSDVGEIVTRSDHPIKP